MPLCLLGHGHLPTLDVPVVGYKNNLFGDGKLIMLHECSDALCCPVHTFKAWSSKTCSLRRGIHRCPLLFSLQQPIKPLLLSRCSAILKDLVVEVGLDPAIFMAWTFHKLGIMVGICTGIKLDTIFRLSGWCSAETFYQHYMVQEIPCVFSDIIFNIDELDAPIQNELML